MPHRRIQCLHCAEQVLVSPRTVSTRCPYCYRRIAVEDFIVSSYHSLTNIETCGSLSVTPTGQVRARLTVHNLHVQGSVNGNVSAHGKVTIDPTARLVGNVDAPRLEVKPGAALKGFYRIVPKASAPETL